MLSFALRENSNAAFHGTIHLVSPRNFTLHVETTVGVTTVSQFLGVTRSRYVEQGADAQNAVKVSQKKIDKFDG